MKSSDPFIQKHLNRIHVIQAALGNKRLFVQCFPTDFDAIHFPNSNFAVKEIFINDESGQRTPADDAVDKDDIAFINWLTDNYTESDFPGFWIDRDVWKDKSKPYYRLEDLKKMFEQLK